MPTAIPSDGTIPLERDLVLTSAERQAADAAITASGVLPDVHGVAEDFMTASAPPVFSPQLRKPTDLMMLMAQAMQHTTQLMGISTQKSVHQIYSAQDASDYLRETAGLIAHSGGAT